MKDRPLIILDEYWYRQNPRDIQLLIDEIKHLRGEIKSRDQHNEKFADDMTEILQSGKAISPMSTPSISGISIKGGKLSLLNCIFRKLTQKELIEQ